MDAPLQVSLTPEQIAAVTAGDGFVRMQDPSTHRVYFLIEQTAKPVIGDEYVRSKIDEAFLKGDIAPLDMAAIKEEFRRRLGDSSSLRR